VELLATGGLKQGRADAALVTLELPAGESRVRVAESPGVQIVRAAGTNLWFGTHSEAGGKPLFSVDLDQLQKNDVEYPVVAYYGGEGRPFCWFSGKFDRYYGESYTTTLTDVAGQSGTGRGTLRYTAGHPVRNLVMPTAITLEPEFGGAAFTLRLQQTLRATGTPTWGDNLEFLHLVINPQYGHDWEDGVPDYVWYRTQREDAPDTLPGSHTTLVRMDDNSRRVYPYPASTADATRIAKSGAHHTGAAVSMEATNTIGGWFTKSGTGCIGLVFHKYQANFRTDLRPLHSHCGDGADTHHLLFWGGLYNPLGMQTGDQVEIEYSLTMLPSEPLLTDIEDLNEADLWLFGTEREQKSRITGWLGTKRAIGLTRSDGSVVILGIGNKPGRVRIPQTARQLKRSFRLFDLGRPTWEQAEIAEGQVQVRPRWVTVLDGGSALNGPP
jgi:hypothetical protein